VPIGLRLQTIAPRIARMNWFFVIALAVSSSIDNLAVGVSYGVRGVRIPLAANLLVAAICFLFSEIGIRLGRTIADVLPGTLPDLIGAALLLVIGLRILLLAWPRRARHPAAEMPATGLRGLVRHAEDLMAGIAPEVGVAEAFILAIALSANALTNALGAGLLGMPPFMIPLTAALGSFITIALGVELGQRLSHIRIGTHSIGQFGTFVSGALLIGLAVRNFL
jgi:putative sporulation protein YtaF